MDKVDLKALGPGEIEEFLASLGLPAFRSRQLLHWMYERRACLIGEITEFSRELRARLEDAAYIGGLRVLERLRSQDGTEKYLFGLEDGLCVESVLIPDEDRLTLCISSQAGCAMGCAFCRTGADGLGRNLRAHEIVEQAIEAGRLCSPRRITNIVLMGMGEPLLNLEQVSRALWTLTGQMHFSPRRITLSTCGIVPGMDALPGAAPPVNLAVSLNATTDRVRDKIMPVNRRYPIAELLAACRRFPLQKRKRITFEYVLLKGVNDSMEDAGRLVGLLRGIPSKVNLIPLNEQEGCGLRSPGEDVVLRFQGVLTGAGLTAFIRKSKGRDILAACGLLKASREAGGLIRL